MMKHAGQKRFVGIDPSHRLGNPAGGNGALPGFFLQHFFHRTAGGPETPQTGVDGQFLEGLLPEQQQRSLQVIDLAAAAATPDEPGLTCHFLVFNEIGCDLA